MDYDVIVVGGGPGGATTALKCVEAGLDTLLLEKRQEIGDPVRCAEGVGKKGLEDVVDRIDKKWIAAEMDKARIFAPDGTMVTLSEDRAGNEVGYVLERKIFDRELVKKASRAGADIMVKTRVTGLLKEDGFIKGVEAAHLDEKMVLHANVVVGADGVESRVGRWAGIDTTVRPKDFETCFEYRMTNVDIDATSCDFYLGTELAPGGYAWVFPKGENEANIGLGIAGDKSGDGHRAYNYLNSFVNDRFPDGESVEIILGGVPGCRPIKETVTDGLLLVGDAARQADPMTGGGIINAMNAATMATEVIVKADEAGDFSKNGLYEYEGKWRSTIGKKIEKMYMAKKVFLSMSDKDLNSLAKSLENEDFKTVSLYKLLAKLVVKNPSLLMGLKTIFK